jgi:pilus assembly protein CpaB
VSEAVLRNVRVLAIGQEIEIKDGEKVATGKTATLELSPRQAETLALAQSMGELSLSLRSLADANPGQAETAAKLGDANASSVKMLKYGVPSRTFGVN